jgi:hypothetical protein
MSQSITLSREERSVLDEILTREEETTRAELHHTDDYTYRRIVKRHLELTRRILEKVRDLPGEYESSEEHAVREETSTRGED